MPRVGFETFWGDTQATQERNRQIREWQSGRLIGVQSPDLVHVDDASAGTQESGMTETVFDTTSKADAARILLTNSTGDTIVLRGVRITGYPVISKPAYVHDSYVNYADMVKNGESILEFSSTDIISADQLNKIAEHKWKEHGTARHAYSFALPGTWHWLRPGGRYHLQVGAAGKAEYVDSFVTCYSVRTTLGREISTQVVMYETAEQFKFDSNAISRFLATGRTTRLSKGSTIRVGTRYSLANVDIRCDGVDDQVQINQMIALLASTGGGGTVHLTGGTYNITAAIEMTSNIILEGEGAITVVKKNCNDYALEGVGGSGSELVEFIVRDMLITRDTDSDTNDIAYLYFDYCDGFSLSNIWILSPLGTGVYAQNCNKADIVDVRLQSINRKGIDAYTSCTAINIRFGGISDSLILEAGDLVRIGQYSSVQGMIFNNISTDTLALGVRFIYCSYIGTSVSFCTFNECVVANTHETSIISSATNVTGCSMTNIDATQEGTLYLIKEAGIASNNVIDIVESEGTLYGITCNQLATGNRISNMIVVGAKSYYTNDFALAGILISTITSSAINNRIDTITINNADNDGDICGVGCLTDDVEPIRVSENHIAHVTIIAGGGVSYGVRTSVTPYSDAIISNNIIGDVDDYGIMSRMDNAVISGNNIRDCATGIEIDTGASKNAVTGNILLNNTDPYDDNGTATSASNNVVV